MITPWEDFECFQQKHDKHQRNWKHGLPEFDQCTSLTCYQIPRCTSLSLCRASHVKYVQNDEFSPLVASQEHLHVTWRILCFSFYSKSGSQWQLDLDVVITGPVFLQYDWIISHNLSLNNHTVCSCSMSPRGERRDTGGAGLGNPLLSESNLSSAVCSVSLVAYPCTETPMTSLRDFSIG